MTPLSSDQVKAIDVRAFSEPFQLIERCIFNNNDGLSLLPKRKSDTHKYNYGRALIIAGCLGYAGAPCLAANACERSGAGLTTLLVPDSIYTVAAGKVDGSVVHPLPCSSVGSLAAESISIILPHLQNTTACLIGPGLGRSDDVCRIVHSVITLAHCPVILDADGINALSGHIDILDKAECPVILTPHEGEFTRLGCSLDSGRIPAASSFAAAHGCTLILKGHRTLVCSGSDVYINTTGGPALAKGGSGDVLSGVLTALIAQGLDPVLSARTAVYLHGLAGDIAAKHLGEYCVTPSDIISALPAAFRSIAEETE